MKDFNTTGICIPSKHYMVDISRQVEEACVWVRKGTYFTINRGRQYGKTTTLGLLKKKLTAEGMCVFSISFEGADNAHFESYSKVLSLVVKLMRRQMTVMPNIKPKIKEMISEFASQNEISDFDFMDLINGICSIDPTIVLIIDEVDQAGNYDSFAKFLGILRNLYLAREESPTLLSVILAGVYDIRHLQLKIRPESEHQQNSPWNIALSFNTDMSLPKEGIARMLQEYKADHNLDFDEVAAADYIHEWTSGYPYFVSRICFLIDANNFTWDREGINNAAKEIINDRSDNLCNSFLKKMNEYPELKELLRKIVCNGVSLSASTKDEFTEIGYMFNFLSRGNNKVVISNRILETVLYESLVNDYKISDIYKSGDLEKPNFITPDGLDMPLILEKFVYHFNKIYSESDDVFIEDQGRKLFLLFLRPIINGIGNYYVEAQTRNQTRTDIIVDYNHKQYIIELKIWHGEKYNNRGEVQLSEYLNHYNLQEGYMVSFSFNKSKVPGVNKVTFGDKVLWEAVV
ncbi:MAG: AAA-like domain-containing protein [Bacteroidales bacterium]|nr:AAA-like domain-containing protein [Bacteroidales bacterium]